LEKAISAARAEKMRRSAGSLSPQPWCCPGTGTHRAGAWLWAVGPCTGNRASVWSQLSASSSQGTANFPGAEEVLEGLLVIAMLLPPLK